MDLVTQTSLEALLLKATNPQNQNIDTAAVEAFGALVNKEKDGPHIGVKVIASRLPSGNEKEMLQTLYILDTCMGRCGSQFQSEVGKFRFLNEMIKLVSPKYLGAHTPYPVKQKVLQLMYMWTLDYPKEIKIREAYDMLRKQGVVREVPNYSNAPDAGPIKKKPVNSVFQDEEKSKILQKLLQSKDPEDIQAANWLIKSMVKEDDKRAELKSRRISILESVQNNARLLNEMLDSYKPGISTADELDLIRELYQSCERLRPNIVKLANETHQNEDMLGDVLMAGDELSQVFDKFESVIKQLRSSNISLLDFENVVSVEGTSNCQNDTKTAKSQIDVLCDIFNASNIPDSAEVLQPTSVLSCDKPDMNEKENNKFKALEDLDVLGEHLLKENLQASKQGNFNRNPEKIPMNLLPKVSDKTQTTNDDQMKTLIFDVSYLIRKPKEEPKIFNTNIDRNGDDCLVDLSDEKMLEASDDSEPPVKLDTTIEKTTKYLTDKLNDIVVNLESIKPSTIPPLTVLDERNGISITIHYAKDKPRENVHVYVITTVSKNELPLDNYLFQAVVPKGCKIKLQPPSATALPAYSPFLPPSAITQVMLVAKPDDVQISLKFIVSYIMDDETYTEMGDVDILPVV